MDRLSCTDSREVTVTLIGENQFAGIQSLDSCCKSRSTTVSSFLPVNINIVVGKHRATYGSNTHAFFCEPHFVDYLSNQLVHNPVATTWAVVHRIIVEKTRLLIHQVLRLYDVFKRENLFVCRIHCNILFIGLYVSAHS